MHESLKNVILVMLAAGVLFAEEHGDLGNEGQLWHITRDKIEQFIPGFIESIVLSLSVPSSVELPTASVPTAEKLDLSPADVIQPQKTATEPVEGTNIV